VINRNRAMLLIMLGPLEAVFLALIFASNRPRRSAEIDALMRYEIAPTRENYEAWQKEGQISQNEVTFRKGTGFVLALSDIAVMVRVYRRKRAT
jgi:hypothetical protein